METKANGLENVIAVTTNIGKVDGERGELVVRGQRMEEYGPAHSYEDVMGLLLGPESASSGEAIDRLGDARRIAFDRLKQRGIFDQSDRDPMDFLRLSLGTALPGPSMVEDAVQAAATLCVAAAAWSRLQSNADPVPPDPSASQAHDYLRMVTGEAPGAGEVRAVETYLVTVTDHGMNASTFTARVIASTQSDLLSAVAGAIGALKGPLHGGAPGPVLDMLDAVGSPEDAEAWIRDELAAGRRIMGMGHRVYRVRDPRAAIFERALSDLQSSGGVDRTERIALARAVESAAERVLSAHYPDRPLKANVEFYTAVLLEAVGIPRELFSPTFAVGRVLGWCAHVMEQRREGRLIRPRSAYTGAVPTDSASASVASTA